MKIPSSFKLLGCTWKVHILAAKHWEDDEAVGYCKPDTAEIYIKRTRRDLMEHTYLHEVLHATLYAMGSKLYDKEEFVDGLSGLLHQVMTSGE